MHSHGTVASGRFAALLTDIADKQAEHDRPLFECHEWIVAPTLGAVIADWLIAIPRDPALNFRVWKERFNREPDDIVSDITNHLGLTSKDVLWFEHGPAYRGSVVGCGADYAHMHLLIRPPFTFDAFVEQCILSSNLQWALATLDKTYESLPVDRSYLVAGWDDKVVHAFDVDSVGSQFFRRVVASFSDRKAQWNYKCFPHADNIAKTIANFRLLEGASHRGR